MQQSTIEANSTQRPPGPSTLRNARSSPAALPSERDSVLSDSDTPISGDAVHAHDLTATHRVVATVEKTSASKKWTGGLSEAEAHLLIFLKEVKKLRWPEITAKFQVHYPTRKYPTLQTNYSQKINRRDRSQDPATLVLPSMYASEAHIDWAEVHANPSRPNDHPRRMREVAALQEEPKHRAWSDAVSSVQDQSSGAESPGHHGRPRRAVPVKNYTWPKKNTRIEVGSFEEDDLDVVEPAEDRLAVSETPEDLMPVPEKAIAVENEPLSIDFDMDDAFSALAVQNREAGPERLPYLSSSQRSGLHNVPHGFEWDQLVSRDWQGTLIHVDFSPIEINVVESTITRLLGLQRDSRSRDKRKRLRRLLDGITEPKLLYLAGVLRSKLHSRDRRSIDAFLRDAQENKIRSAAPRIERLAASRPNKSFRSEAKLSTSSVIRRRELGIQSYRGWSSTSSPISYQLKNRVQDSLGPVCSYTGASSDVHAVAWSVDGECFAAGAICVDDPHSMQYNRSNNLLYGDVARNTIHELGKHYVQRPRTDSGPNSTHAMYASQDPKLFKTVTSVAFSPNGNYMFSGGWDQNVWVWETKYDGLQPADAVSLHHKSEVSMMAVNSSGVLATGTRKSTGNAVKVLNLREDDLSQPPVTLNFNSEKAAARPDQIMLPMALHFSPRYENLLLGGFGATARQDGRDTNGDICLWDINGNKQLNVWGSGKYVFDLSFHPRERWMAVATVAGQNTNRGMRSTVRLYSEGNAMDDKFSTLMELECRALDINDVVWCPDDNYLVAAGCTNGRAYVWDIRNPNHVLRELAHASSLMPLDEREDREITDTGIRFLSWGNNATRLYSGSSDGVVKVWNVARSEEETFVKDLITVDSGIMSGAFSPDYSKLLLGEVNGSVNVLEVGRDDCSLKDAAKMKYISYEDDDPEFETQPSTSTSAAADSGIASARELLETGQMITRPMGGLPIKQAVQGPSYAGPYDASVDAPFLRKQALEMQLKFPETSESPCSVCLGPESNPVKITSEEIGDSGRSLDRIPNELRSRWLAGTVDLKIPPAMVPCGSCGRAARPFDRVYSSGGTPLPPRCERCDFTCLRCGGHDTTLSIENESYVCFVCKLNWEIGALGYNLTEDFDNLFGRTRTYANHSSRRRKSYDDIPKLDGYKKDLYLAKLEAVSRASDEDITFGDEINALTDHYFSLAIDRPESPPL
ncbi:WD40 repeat-like protein [Karstenula rhodostoma CBS 690.94]|uniref:WD40 repeat-like protein n=1 Tax=Karstenula rhodostoma CBS 690.94 TaxID=1392251 RepID=A0A9P4PI76_9PLEO|nr:WD40 repeat-like protein [Karstenula rhodostoma CBS 690.94]